MCAGVLLAPAVAAAQTGCPPGDWFCVPAPPAAAPPPPAAPSEEPANHAVPAEPTRTPPELRLATPPPPPPVERRSHRPWGLKTHLLVPIVGGGAASNYFMGGLGFGGRARPDPAVALDLTLDSLTGIDYTGNHRDEFGFNFATSVFFNPRDLVQGFFTAGLGWSRANVAYEDASSKYDRTYHYFGMFAGLGIEWQIKSQFSLDFALLGLLRSRTDSDANDHPEFSDPNTKLATNSSGAGIVRLGLIYYF